MSTCEAVVFLFALILALPFIGMAYMAYLNWIDRHWH